MSLPRITHLQFLVLRILLDKRRTGRKLRARLREIGARRTGPAFYQLMGRLEGAGYVAGAYRKRKGPTQVLQEKRYELTPDGMKVFSETADFYRKLARGTGGAKRSAPAAKTRRAGH